MSSLVNNIERVSLLEVEEQRLWLKRDYISLVEEQAAIRNIRPYIASLRYGELSMSKQDRNWKYNDQLGLFCEI